MFIITEGRISHSHQVAGVSGYIKGAWNKLKVIICLLTRDATKEILKRKYLLKIEIDQFFLLWQNSICLKTSGKLLNVEIFKFCESALKASQGKQEKFYKTTNDD